MGTVGQGARSGQGVWRANAPHVRVTGQQIAQALQALLADPEAVNAMGPRCLEIHGSDPAPGVDRVIEAMEEACRPGS